MDKNKEEKMIDQDSLLFGIERAKASGYKTEFMFQEGLLVDRQTLKSYNNDDCHLFKYERFEGLSDPADSSILCWVECLDGVKGHISSAYGIYADVDLVKFLQSLSKVDDKEKL